MSPCRAATEAELIKRRPILTFFKVNPKQHFENEIMKANAIPEMPMQKKVEKVEVEKDKEAIFADIVKIFKARKLIA